jgi:hypothetical protein
MRLFIPLTACALASAAGVAALAAQVPKPVSVEIKDAVVRVVVLPEDRADVKVEVFKTNPKLPLAVRTAGQRTIIDGKLEWDVGDCGANGGKPTVRVKKIGEIAWADMPRVLIRTPRNVSLTAGGAVFGVVGRSASLDMVNAGCGGWVVGDVAGKFSLSQAGSGDSRIGSVGQASVRSAGSGDVRIVSAKSGLTVNIAGSGDVEVAQASGPIDVKIVGSGDVGIRKGAAEALTVAVTGSGDVDFGGIAKSLKARVAGSGDVRAKAVTGKVEKSVAGSGGVTIG